MHRQNRGGFTLLELLICLCVLSFTAVVGWAIAFAFSYEVFIPWLGCVPAEYHKLAAVISAFVLDGLFSCVITVITFVAGAALIGRFLGKRRRRF